MINKPILELLRRCIPGMEGCEDDEENGRLIVTVPKADSIFFREEFGNPILQHIYAFKRIGIEFDTGYIVDEEAGEIVLSYKYAEKSDLIEDWRSLLECDDYVDVVEDDDFVRRLFSR